MLVEPFRRRRLHPDRLVSHVAELLAELETVASAIAATVDDRWSEGAEHLHAAVVALRAPTKAQQALRDVAAREEAAHLEAERLRLDKLQDELDKRWLAGLRAQRRGHVQEPRRRRA